MSKSKKEKKCAECEKNLAGWKRALADYENLKKQVEKEKDAFVKFANLNLIMGLIPVYNNLKLACDHAPKNDEWAKGVEQVKKQFEQVLKYNNVEEIIPQKDENFNPGLHEAVHEELRIKNPSSAKATADRQELSNKIKKVVSTGYKLHGRVFMPAKVIVK